MLSIILHNFGKISDFETLRRKLSFRNSNVEYERRLEIISANVHMHAFHDTGL